MEGSRRGTALVAVVSCVLLAGSGCGGDDPTAASPAAVKTANPEKTFAPLFELAENEPWRPMSARWFIEHSVFWFAEDEGCADRKIAVGRTLPEQQNPEIDWIYPKGLGGWSWPAYYRNPYDASCELDFDKTFYADQLTRPHDPGRRIEGARAGEGYYLDLVDHARPGPASRLVPVYSERTDEGDSGVRLTYWVLYGMHGTAGHPNAHEGDWQRVDLLLRDVGDGAYEPLAVQLEKHGGDALEPVPGEVIGPPGGRAARDTPWTETARTGSTHPIVRVQPVTHAMTITPPGERCADCRELKAWESLADARTQLWYGFGGAWGQPGTTDATTGPLGPHTFWPNAAEKEREVVEQAREIAGD